MKSLFRHPQVKFDKEKPDHTSLFNQESHLARKSNETKKRNAVDSNELLASLESLLASASHFVSASPQETFPRSRDSRQSRHPQLAAHRAHNLRTQHVFATRVLTPSFAFLENSRDHRGDIPATTPFCTLSLSLTLGPSPHFSRGMQRVSLHVFPAKSCIAPRGEWPPRNCPPPPG